MKLSRQPVLQFVVLILLNVVVISSSASNELSDDDASCPAEKESCGCSGTNRLKKDISIENSETRENDILSNDASPSDDSSLKADDSPALNRRENVDFPRRNQMVLIKGVYMELNSFKLFRLTENFQMVCLKLLKLLPGWVKEIKNYIIFIRWSFHDGHRCPDIRC
jgi:hypothetical protein